MPVLTTAPPEYCVLEESDRIWRRTPLGFPMEVDFIWDRHGNLGKVHPQWAQDAEGVYHYDSVDWMRYRVSDSQPRLFMVPIELPDHQAPEVRGYRISNLEIAMGKYYNLTDAVRFDAFSKMGEHVNHSDPIAYQRTLRDGTVYNSHVEVGTVEVRYHPPIEDALMLLARHFFQQDIPLLGAVNALIKQHRRLSVLTGNSLAKLSEFFSPDGAKGKITQRELSGDLQQLANVITQSGQAWVHSEYLQNVMRLWNRAHQILLDIEQEGIDAGEVRDLDWQAALKDAERLTGVSHPPVHHAHHLNDDATLSDMWLTWATAEGIEVMRVDLTQQTQTFILGDVEAGADIPATATEVQITCRLNDAEAELYYNGAIQTSPVTQTYAILALVPDPEVAPVAANLTVVAENQLAKQEYSLTFQRETVGGG